MRDSGKWHGFICGAIIGVANIIPGVSGGTMALMLGIYEKILHTIQLGNPVLWIKIFRKARSSTQSSFFRYVYTEFIALGGIWAICVVGGAGAAIVGCSWLMKWLLLNHHVLTYGFFAGLVAASIIVPWAMISKRTYAGWLALLLAALSVFYLARMQEPEQKIARAEQRYALKQQALENSQPIAMPVSDSMTYVFAGAVAASAMILPGISGSFMLVLMGVYFDVITAIVDKNFTILFALAIGAILGLLTLSRLLEYFLKIYRDTTMMALTGLMIGSLYGLWPFQIFTVIGDKKIFLQPTLPENITQAFLTVAVFIIGSGIVLAFLKFAPAKASEHK